MTDIVVTGELPASGPRKRPIADVAIYYRRDESFEWTLQDDDLPLEGTVEVRFGDVDAGPWFFRGVIVYDDGTELESFASADVGFDDPEPFVTFTATVEG